MIGVDVVAKVRELNLPKGSFIVFGAAPMAVAGLREANDIDLLVNLSVIAMLKSQNWKQVIKGPKDEPFTSGIFEAHSNWDFSSYAPTLEQLLKTAFIVEDVPFAALEEVRKWKMAWGRPKDMEDVRLIDSYLLK